jgi:hypothetical protein
MKTFHTQEEIKLKQVTNISDIVNKQLVLWTILNKNLSKVWKMTKALSDQKMTTWNHIRAIAILFSPYGQAIRNKDLMWPSVSCLRQIFDCLIWEITDQN